MALGLREEDEHVTVISSGDAVVDTAKLLSSANAGKDIATARELFELILDYAEEHDDHQSIPIALVAGETNYSPEETNSSCD